MLVHLKPWAMLVPTFMSFFIILPRCERTQHLHLSHYANLGMLTVKLTQAYNASEALHKITQSI